MKKERGSGLRLNQWNRQFKMNHDVLGTKNLAALAEAPTKKYFKSD